MAQVATSRRTIRRRKTGGSRRILPAWCALLAGLLLLLNTGCASKKATPDDALRRPLIKEIEFEGMSVFEKDEILAYVYMDETSWLHGIGLADPHTYSKSFAVEDAGRIESLYAAHGYYDARVTDIRSEPLNEAGDKVRVIVQIKEGPPTRLRTISFDWSEPHPDRVAIEKQAVVKPDAVFSIPDLDAGTDALRLELERRGHAFAQVTSSAEVNREARWSDVRFAIAPGPLCTIGSIRYEGLATVPGRLLDPNIDFAPGQRYSPELLARIERAIYAMEVFDTVAVLPDENLNEKGKLDLVIRVREGQPQRFKVGVGLGVEPNRWDGHVSLQYTHMNVAQELIRFDLLTRVGYALLPYPWDVQEHGPILEVNPWFKKKGWLEPKLVWSLQPSFKLDIEQGYQYYTPGFRLGVSRFLFGFTLAEAAYNAQFFDFFNQSAVFDANKSVLGRDYKDPYFLSFLEFRYSVYFTDAFTDPKNGVVLSARYDISGSWLGSYYDYMKLIPEIRAYWQTFSHLQIAARLQTGWLFKYGQKPGTPIMHKYYLGGSDTVRGWGLKRLSPRIEDCDADGHCRSIPVGGETMALGNFELRFKVIESLYIVPFVDAGDVQDGEMTYKPTQWSYSTGGGMRYASPIGKFRVDFGWRLNQPARFAGEQRWAIHLSFGETF